MWETKRDGEKKRTTIGRAGEEKGRGVRGAQESLCSGKSCESHTGEKLQGAHGKMKQNSEAGKSHLLYQARTSTLKTAAHF